MHARHFLLRPASGLALWLGAVLWLVSGCHRDVRPEGERAAMTGVNQAAMGVGQAAAEVNCNRVPGLCWEDQICDQPTGYCREATVDAALDYDVQLYDYTLDLSTATRSFSGQVAIFLVATHDGTSRITLDVGRTQDVPVEGALTPYTPYTVRSVRDHSGAKLTFVQEPTQGSLTVTLATPLRAHASEVLTLSYQGPFNPITDTKHPLYLVGLMQREGKLGHSLVQTFSWPHHARRWLPSHDHPRDTARAIAHVGIDNGWLPQANGVLVPSAGDGPGRRTFVLRQPVPTYALHVIASNFERVPMGQVAGVPVDAYMYPDATERSIPLLWWRELLPAMAVFNETFGPFAFERYAMVEVPASLGGMEHATLVSISDASTGEKREADHGRSLVIHELLHHWWGDSGHQASWEEFWLNESLASFYTAEVLDGVVGAGATQEAMDRMKEKLFKEPSRYDDDALRPVHEQEQVPGEVTSASFSAPYVKGPWVWRMIRLHLGERAFAAFMKRFYEATRFKPYSTAQVLRLLNAEGPVDFTPFFQEWVYGKGWPRLASTWRYDGARRVIHLSVRQTQDVARYGTYTFTGPLALTYVFDDANPATPACEGVVTFQGGALESAVDIPCASTPTTMGQPFTRNLLVELAP